MLKNSEKRYYSETIFEEVSYFKKNNIPVENIIACATDGALPMIGRYGGFIAHLKNVSEVFYIHCVIHWQYLVSIQLNVCLHEALSIVIKVANCIKSNSLRDRVF